MIPLTNRRIAIFLTGAMLILTAYVLSSDWTFEEMRDGTLIGAFPMVYLALCLLFAVLIGAGEQADEVLDDTRKVSIGGLLRIAAFTFGASTLAFFHETYGFVLLSFILLCATAWFCGQRRPIGIAAYALVVSLALFGLFRLLDFDLSIFPGIGI